MKRRRSALGLAAALICTACGDGTGPAAPASTFDLVRYEDNPLPVVLSDAVEEGPTPGAPGARCETRLASMRIVLGDDGRYSRTSGEVVACSDGRPDIRSSSTETGTYATIEDNVIRMMASLPDLTDPASPLERLWFATRTARELRVLRRNTVYTPSNTTDEFGPLLFEGVR